MVKHAPDNLGPGIIKFHQFTIAFIILTVIPIVVAFMNWHKGSKSSGYLFILFLLPFLALPIAVIIYLIFNGFNWYFWSIVQTTISILFLGMFTTFGFSVAQGMNDLKQEFIDKQLVLNNALESKVDIRTADLRKISEELTAANNGINKSIQAASVTLHVRTRPALVRD